MTIRIPKWALTACMSAVVSSLAHAQLIDDIELRREGNNAVVQIHFVTPVQFQNSLNVQSGDLVQVFYVIQGSPDTANSPRGERKVEGIKGLPEISISDEFVTGSITRRKMVLNFSEATRQQVRSGRNRQSIEIVLEGRGPALTAAYDLKPEPGDIPPLPAVVSASPAAAAVVENQGRYVISLLRSDTPKPQLTAPVPPELRGNTFFYSQRLDKGKTVYEVNLGYFTTLPAAEDARAKLLNSFPGATIMAIVSRSPAPPPAVASPAPAAAPAVAAAPVAPPPVSAPVPAAAPAAAVSIAAAAEAQGRYVISLLRSDMPKPTLTKPLPSEFTGNTLFSSQRLINGKPVYELNLGFFPTPAAAESARSKLIGSYPGANVMAVAPKPATPSSTATATAPAPSAAPAAPAAPAAAVAAAAVAAIPTPSVPAPAPSSQAAAAKPAPAPAPVIEPAAIPAAAPQVAAVTPPPSATQPVGPNLSPLVSVVPGTDKAIEPTLLTPHSQAEANAMGARLLAGAQDAFDKGDFQASLETLNSLLNLPTNPSSRKAQELIGQTRLKLGDKTRARSEFELFLQLYPRGADSDQVRKVLATLPAAAGTTARVRPPIEPTSTTSGSVSLFYFGGQSQVRSQDFQNSPISGLPVLQNESTLSGTDLKQVQTNIDLNWRYRDTDKDMRFVFRNTSTADQISGNNRNRLSAMYFDQKNFVNNTNFRVGRQSPTGGGVMYRYDGVSAGYGFAPHWRINTSFGKPSDDLLDTNRTFYGFSLENEAITPEFSGNIYFNQGNIDGEIDRQALGTELRYFSGGVALSGQYDYDQILQGTNVASLQGSWILPDNTAFNFMFDRRATPFRSLSNALFFQDPNSLTIARKISDLLLTTSVDDLRARVNAITATQTQGMAGFTTPIAKNWQTGANVTYVNVGEIPAVPIILPSGQPSTGDLWSAGFQLIGSNLYSVRDTHVYSLSLLSGPTYNGKMLSYNNLTSLNEKWQVEPSIRYYTQTDSTDTNTVRWTPGLRITYRMAKQVTVESEATYEISEINGPLRTESSTRLFYYLGGRYDF